MTQMSKKPRFWICLRKSSETSPYTQGTLAKEVLRQYWKREEAFLRERVFYPWSWETVGENLSGKSVKQ